MVFPEVLGEGKRLFAGGLAPTQAEADRGQAVGPDGIRLLTYERGE